MKLPDDEIEALVGAAEVFRSRSVTFSESVRRLCEASLVGRTFVTGSRFSMDVKDVAVLVGGGSLAFLGGKSCYLISLQDVQSFKAQGDELEIAEHFEQQTERHTRIRLS